MVGLPKTNKKKWLKPGLALLILGLIAWLAPVAPLDPWNLLSPKKVVVMIFALTLVQVFGSVMAQLLGARLGSIFTGFFGGLVSSTATTASLARQSKAFNDVDSSSEMLIFLSATGAMLFEGLALVLAGTSGIHLSLLIVFFGTYFGNSGDGHCAVSKID